MLGQELLHGFGRVTAAIVADQANLATRIRVQSHGQEEDKGGPTFCIGDRIRELAAGVLHSPIAHLLLVFAGRGDLGLLTHRCPHPRQRRKAMNFQFILKDQHVCVLRPQGFFFMACNSWRACS